MEELFCPNCKESISKIEFECSNCKYPLSGTDKEKAVFIGRQISNKSKIDDAKTSQNKIRIILYIIGGFQLLNALMAYLNGYDMGSYLFYFILGSIFILFGYLSPKKPLVFISLALILLLAYYAFLYSINPRYLTQGLIWKIISVSFLVYGIVKSLEERQLKKQNKYLN